MSQAPTIFLIDTSIVETFFTIFGNNDIDHEHVRHTYTQDTNTIIMKRVYQDIDRQPLSFVDDDVDEPLEYNNNNNTCNNDHSSIINDTDTSVLAVDGDNNDGDDENDKQCNGDDDIIMIPSKEFIELVESWVKETQENRDDEYDHLLIIRDHLQEHPNQVILNLLYIACNNNDENQLFNHNNICYNDNISLMCLDWLVDSIWICEGSDYDSILNLLTNQTKIQIRSFVLDCFENHPTPWEDDWPLLFQRLQKIVNAILTYQYYNDDGDGGDDNDQSIFKIETFKWFNQYNEREYGSLVSVKKSLTIVDQVLFGILNTTSSAYSETVVETLGTIWRLEKAKGKKKKQSKKENDLKYLPIFEHHLLLEGQLKNEMTYAIFNCLQDLTQRDNKPSQHFIHNHSYDDPLLIPSLYVSCEEYIDRRDKFPCIETFQSLSSTFEITSEIVFQCVLENIILYLHQNTITSWQERLTILKLLNFCIPLKQYTKYPEDQIIFDPVDNMNTDPTAVQFEYLTFISKVVDRFQPNDLDPIKEDIFTVACEQSLQSKNIDIVCIASKLVTGFIRPSIDCPSSNHFLTSLLDACRKNRKIVQNLIKHYYKSVYEDQQHTYLKEIIDLLLEHSVKDKYVLKYLLDFRIPETIRKELLLYLPMMIKHITEEPQLLKLIKTFQDRLYPYIHHLISRAKEFELQKRIRNLNQYGRIHSYRPEFGGEDTPLLSLLLIALSANSREHKKEEEISSILQDMVVTFIDNEFTTDQISQIIRFVKDSISNIVTINDDYEVVGFEETIQEIAYLLRALVISYFKQQQQHPSKDIIELLSFFTVSINDLVSKLKQLQLQQRHPTLCNILDQFNNPIEEIYSDVMVDYLYYYYEHNNSSNNTTPSSSATTPTTASPANSSPSTNSNNNNSRFDFFF
ncbi:hypothetical protein DFA_10508 [Cavenderia fasciculata]|uniref:Uncharacterized protein n=1 Tax=Cavenderia fasciculata TaxID=261658 RepID=F4QAE7_CACFS|nr:uncharacterized protein DFA_10508 [Cavenderia fasciculata]EGG15666.1 hypothetical protein DFA_10508 [Cavenderia fasciculata]|eukprot:XP_004354408.1 hypothetical protein DFA_10508 [Cavenderia fasciculata]